MRPLQEAVRSARRGGHEDPLDLRSLLDQLPEHEMKKRSKYRPKGVRLDNLTYVIQGLTPMAKHGDHLVTLKIKNHQALAALTQGRATLADVNVLIATLNIAEALYRMGFGREYKDVVAQGLLALRAVGGRGIATGRFILTGPEMNALNIVMELHDAQLDLCVVQDIEKAIDLVRREEVAGRMTPIKATQHANNPTTAGDNPASQTTDNQPTTNSNPRQEPPG